MTSLAPRTLKREMMLIAAKSIKEHADFNTTASRIIDVLRCILQARRPNFQQPVIGISEAVARRSDWSWQEKPPMLPPMRETLNPIGNMVDDELAGWQIR